MPDEAIRKDVESPITGEGSTPEQKAAEPESQANEAPEPGESQTIDLALDPVSKREAAMRAVKEKAIEQREQDRKSAALINDPDMTEEEYDRRMEQQQREELEARRQELDEQLERTSDPSTETPEQAQHEAPDAREGQAPKLDENGWFEKDGQRFKRIRVNGEDRDLTQEEYDRALSKELAGDQKLELANRMVANANQKLEDVSRREQALKMAPPEDSGVSEEDIKKALDEYHEAFMEGDTDVARDRLASVMMQARAPAQVPNLDALADEAATRAAEKEEARRRGESVKKGWDSFRSEYPEIATDRENLAIADVILKRVRQDNPDWTPEQQIAETGRLTAEKLQLKAKQSSEQEPDDNPTDERAQRKSRLQPVPKAGGRVHKAEKEKRMDMSPEAKIRRMRQGRAV